MRPIKNFSRGANLLQSAFDVHFNLTSHFRRQLNKPPLLHGEDSKFLAPSILGVLGESPFMRQYFDKPSQIANVAIKEWMLKPTSDVLLSVREVMDRDLIETSLELERKRRRYPLRELSVYNVFNNKEARENLVESHCCGIVDEANKILQSNLRNLLTKNLKDQKSFNILAEIFNSNTKHDKRSISDLTFLDETLHKAKEFFVKQGIEEESLNNIFTIYDNTILEAKNKRNRFQEKINEVQALEDEYGIDRLKVEFAKVRLLYAAEWLARAKVVGIGFSALDDIITSEEMTSVNNDAFSRNLNQSALELKTILGKQVITTILGATINSSSRNKDGTNGRYMIACDTEFHDYLKFLPRVFATFIAGMTAYAMSDQSSDQEASLAESLTRDLVKMSARFISGSHIAMRMFPKDMEDLLTKICNSVQAQDIEPMLKDETQDHSPLPPVVSKQHIDALTLDEVSDIDNDERIDSDREKKEELEYIATNITQSNSNKLLSEEYIEALLSDAPVSIADNEESEEKKNKDKMLKELKEKSFEHTIGDEEKKQKDLMLKELKEKTKHKELTMNNQYPDPDSITVLPISPKNSTSDLTCDQNTEAPNKTPKISSATTLKDRSKSQ